MAPAKRTLYEVLGVPRDASGTDIGLAYETRSAELQRAAPPDPGALALLREAHAILSDPDRRAAYDASLAADSARAEARAQARDLPADEESPARKLPMIPLAVGGAVVVLAVVIAFRASWRDAAPTPAPLPAVESTAPSAPAPLPPPKLRGGSEILADASASGGRLLAYALSGESTPVGVALAVAPGTMITTCHGIPAGAKLVVEVGREPYPAELTLADERLNLCRLAVSGFTVPPFEVAPELPPVGERIFAVGMNFRGEMAATEGTVTGLRKSPVGEVLEISVPISPTSSGGGVFDTRGRLVGIATTAHKFGPGVPIALPATWLSKLRSRSPH